MATDDSPHKISVGMLPSGSLVVFKESAYFSRNGPGCSLPSPAEVRANEPLGYRGESLPAQFEALNLFVKYGKEVTIAEGQCLWVIRHLLPYHVPVPEVYGWSEEGGEVFIYMELVKGITLENRWESLSKQERIKVCEQLRAILLELRNLQQDPKDQFLGKLFKKSVKTSKLITLKAISTVNLSWILYSQIIRNLLPAHLPQLKNSITGSLI